MNIIYEVLNFISKVTPVCTQNALYRNDQRSACESYIANK